MAFLPETAQRVLAITATPENGHILPQKIKELSIERWGKEIALLGHHLTFCEALQKLEQFAPSDEPVLITGESGVGKELFARALYLLSRRNNAPYVCVNCGRFDDENLMVSKLFGHAKGSFTGAVQDRQGVFESANDGMILLDEIGELSLRAQKMLLRVIEQKEIMPLGSTKTKQIDIRVISATHRDLASMVETGQFREDLFYRLNCLHLHIPALRERGDDLSLLLRYYLNKLNEAHGVERQFSPEALAYLKQYGFHGNIRELKSIVETGFRVCEGNVIQLNDVTEKMQNRRSGDLLPLDIADYYNRMVDKGESFWEVIREPFMNRDLSRSQVKAIIQKGLKAAGSYKGLARLFNIPLSKHKKFLNFLQAQKLKP
jgi:DNA-binding NtrC family response regulator